MATTYTYGNDPTIGGTAAQKRDVVRFLAQDNQADASSQYKSTDEEIAFLLATEANEFMAAARLCELLANRGGPVSRKKVGDLELDFGSQAQYLALAKALKARGQTYQIPTIGGVSRDGKTTLTDDTDWIKPLFSRAMMEHPAVPTDAGTLSDDGC